MRYTVPRKPSLLVVTDIDDKRLDRASQLLSPAAAERAGVKLIYVNTKEIANPLEHLTNLNNGAFYDDVFVFAPVKNVLELADNLLGRDGCLNFFAGPSDPSFTAQLNFYNVHYESHHIVGTSGGNTDDMKEALDMMLKGEINPAFMITHIGGLNAAAETTVNLDKIPGGKKLIYTHKKLDLTAIEDFAQKGREEPLFASLAQICGRHQGLWNAEAEKYFLENAPEI